MNSSLILRSGRKQRSDEESDCLQKYLRSEWEIRGTSQYYPLHQEVVKRGEKLQKWKR